MQRQRGQEDELPGWRIVWVLISHIIFDDDDMDKFSHLVMNQVLTRLGSVLRHSQGVKSKMHAPRSVSTHCDRVHEYWSRIKPRRMDC